MHLIVLERVAVVEWNVVVEYSKLRFLPLHPMFAHLNNPLYHDAIIRISIQPMTFVQSSLAADIV